MTKPVEPPPPPGAAEPPQPAPAPPAPSAAPAAPSDTGRLDSGRWDSIWRGIVGTLRRRRGAGRRAGNIAAAVVIGLGIFGVKWLNRDQGQDAKVGDCLSADAGTVPAGQEKQAVATVVSCTSADAAYAVVGRVEHDTSTSSKACSAYFTEDTAEYAVFAIKAGQGYLLCLRKA